MAGPFYSLKNKTNMKLKLSFTKTRKVKTPTRGTKQSSGIDFYIPEDAFGEHQYDRLSPGEDINIPSGIHVKLPESHVGIFFNKSGVATKKHLQIGACVIDEDYQGEVHLHVRNIGRLETTLHAGDKIAQMVILPQYYMDLEEVETLESLYPEKSERGDGGFGSTGSK